MFLLLYMRYNSDKAKTSKDIKYSMDSVLVQEPLIEKKH